MRERTPLKLLHLSGSGNIARHNARVKAEADAPPLTPDRQKEIADLDILISKTMKACMKGSTRNKKGNPAFGHLAMLVRLRELLTRGHDPEEQEASTILDELDAKLAGAQ
jgi:hypothetical protein